MNPTQPWPHAGTPLPVLTLPLGTFGDLRKFHYGNLSILALGLSAPVFMVWYTYFRIVTEGYSFGAFVFQVSVTFLSVGLTISTYHRLTKVVRDDYGTIDPRGWLDQDNAYGVLKDGRSEDEMRQLCEDLCLGRWRIQHNYVYVQQESDAACLRLAMK